MRTYLYFPILIKKKLMYKLFLFLIAIHLVFANFYGVYHLNGISMRPTLSDKQFVFSFVDYYKNNEINYGDIVFLNVKGEEDPLIKRVVGLPGDKIEMKKGILIVNDIPKTIDKELEMNIYEEKINDFKSFRILNITKANEEDYFEEIKIPDGFYFVLGDNRENSRDSRDIGLIPENNIIDKYIPETHFVYNFSWYFFSLAKIVRGIGTYSQKLFNIVLDFPWREKYNDILYQIEKI